MSKSTMSPLEWSSAQGLQLRQPGLLEQALTHRSFAHEAGPGFEHNERLEYLGDSVLGFIVSEHLYRSHPDFPEGRMARIKSKVVSEPALAEAAADLGLGGLLRLGRGEESSGGRERPSTLADAFEAVVGAIHLDCGLETARRFVLGALQQQLARALSSGKDPKTTLQELVQKRHHTTPTYETLSEEGPDHAKVFTCRVVVEGSELARGRGNSRQSAERVAASEALQKIAAAPE